MKKHNENCCPCCGRHCPREKLCCKHGRIYFSKLESKESKPDKDKKEHKWARYTQEDGLARQLLHTARRTKKCLRKSHCTEAEVFGILNKDEQLALSALLQKLQSRLVKPEKNNVSSRCEPGI